MSKKPGVNSAQILLFPTGEATPAIDLTSPGAQPASRSASRSAHTGPEKGSPYEVVLSGTFRRDVEGLRRARKEFLDLGVCRNENVDQRRINDIQEFGDPQRLVCC